jgi:hypothetical protein
MAAKKQSRATATFQRSASSDGISHSTFLAHSESAFAQLFELQS